MILTTVTGVGTLFNDADLDGVVDGGEALVATNSVSLVDIAAGQLKFKPVANAHGTGYDSFTFQVQDSQRWCYDFQSADTTTHLRMHYVATNSVSLVDIAAGQLKFKPVANVARATTVLRSKCKTTAV